jgi:hypothetical protein
MKKERKKEREKEKKKKKKERKRKCLLVRVVITKMSRWRKGQIGEGGFEKI